MMRLYFVEPCSPRFHLGMRKPSTLCWALSPLLLVDVEGSCDTPLLIPHVRRTEKSSPRAKRCPSMLLYTFDEEMAAKRIQGRYRAHFRKTKYVH